MLLNSTLVVAGIAMGPPMQQIEDWLEQLGMAEYAARFATNKIDVSVLRYLTQTTTRETRHRTDTVTRDEPVGRRLSEIRTPLPEVKPDRRPILIAGSPLCPQLHLSVGTGVFEGKISR